MKKTKVLMPLISMLVPLTVVGCNGSTPEPSSSSSSSNATSESRTDSSASSSSSSSETLHQADGKYQSDETYHWQGCTANDDHVYLKGVHTFVENGSVKTCSVCGYTATTTKE